MMTALTLVTLTLLAPPPALEITLSRSEDTAELHSDDGRAAVAITSARGIGGVTLTLAEKQSWPKGITLDLGLKALEGLTISGGEFRLHTSLNATMPEISRRVGEAWEPVKPDRELVPTIRRVGKRVHVEIPSGWLKPTQRQLKIDWVDYYRG